MFNEEYEKREENLKKETEIESGTEKAEETGKASETSTDEKAEETKGVNFTMVDSSASKDSSQAAAGQGSYETGQTAGSQNSYGAGQNGGSQYGYGSSQNTGSQSGYTSSQNTGNQYGYGTSQNAGTQNGYTNSQNTGSQGGYGNGRNYGGQYGYGNTQNTGSQNGYGAGQNPGGYGSYGNSQNTGNQSGYGSRQPYSNPQSSANSQNPQNSGQIQHYAPWQHGGQGGNHAGKNPDPKKKSHPILKRAAGITAAALLFGVVAGGTIAGIGFVMDGLRSQYAVSESPTLSQTETTPATTESSSDSSTVTYVTTNDVSSIVEKAMPSVVAINSVTEYQTQNFFGQPQTYEGRGSGSGIIVGESDTELLIVTNNHVIEGANTLSVTFNDGESAEANVKGTDSENDLAVIAVALDQITDSTKSKITVATIGDSDSLKVGQGVIAIGNALGYGQSVTVGYVSALDREVTTEDGTTRNLLQTDAAINPGNSGGALLNMQGEVVGINSAKYSSTEVEGMGYAIPISKVEDIIDDLMTRKTRVQVDEANQGYLGIQGTDIDSNAATLYGMPQGIFVYKIMEDGAAASSTLQEKDIITEFDGQSVRSMTELKDMLTYYAGGDTVDLTVQRLENGQYVEHTVTITLGVNPEGESAQQ